MTEPDRVCINCMVLRETEKAWLVDDGTQEVWVPKSRAELYNNADGSKDLFIEEWIAKEKGLI